MKLFNDIYFVTGPRTHRAIDSKSRMVFAPFPQSPPPHRDTGSGAPELPRALDRMSAFRPSY